MTNESVAVSIELEEMAAPPSTGGGLTHVTPGTHAEAVGAVAPPAIGPTSPREEVRLRVVTHVQEECGQQHLIEVHEGQAVATIIPKLKAAEQPSTFDTVLHNLIGKKRAIYEARVTLQNPADLEAQNARVFLEPTKPKLLPEVSFAYNHSDKCETWPNFVSGLKPYGQLQNGGEGPQRALVVGWKTDKTMVAVESLIAAATAIGIGVLVGVVLHDATLGVGVSAGIVGFEAFIAYVMAKLSK